MMHTAPVLTPNIALVLPLIFLQLMRLPLNLFLLLLWLDFPAHAFPPLSPAPDSPAHAHSAALTPAFSPNPAPAPAPAPA